MMLKNDIALILQKFENIEKKYELDNHKIGNINWWDSLRYLTYEELLVQLDLSGFQFYKDDEESLKKSKVNIIFVFINRLNNFLFSLFSFKSPILIKKKSNIIFGHPRRIFENNFYIDKYSDPFIEIFQKRDDFSVIENPIHFSHLKPAKTKNLFYGDMFIILSKILSKFLNLEPSEKDSNFIKKLENEINFTFNVNINLYNKIKLFLPLYKAETLLYKFFFKLKNPKKIFVVNSAGYESMIEAAKLLTIKTYELQHGSPARGKLNYDYSSGIKKSTFPDFFLSFGKFWTNDIKLPIDNDKIIEIGFPYLNQKLDNKDNLFKKENIFLIISQPNMSKNLVPFCIELKKKIGDKIKILYKPHPLELLKNEANYIDKLERNNISVIQDYDCDLYKLLNKSKWVLGISSTVLYEAIAFKCRVFILKEPSYEKTFKLLKLKFAHLIHSTQDFDQLLDKDIDFNSNTIFFNDGNKRIKSLFIDR